MEKTTTLEQQVSFTRLLNAPRELVFKVWTDPVHLAKWWGPKGFTSPVCRVDARTSGKIYIDMKGPDGVVYPMTGTYTEVVKPSKLVFTARAHFDENNTPLIETITTVTLTEENGKTRMVVEAVVTKMIGAGAQSVAGMEQGWSQSLDRLKALLETITTS